MYTMKRVTLLLLLVLGATSMNAWADDEAVADEVSEVVEKPEKEIFGHDELVILPDFNNIEIHAKLDTGAKTASLSAQDLKVFTKNKETWVRFQLENGKKYYEFPLVGISKIKKRANELESNSEEDIEETSVERPVISLDVCLGDRHEKIRVNLTDRSNFKFELLIGKEGLTKLGAIVDPSISETTKPVCKVK